MYAHRYGARVEVHLKVSCDGRPRDLKRLTIVRPQSEFVYEPAFRGEMLVYNLIPLGDIFAGFSIKLAEFVAEVY